MSRACRDERVATQHGTTFSCVKMRGLYSVLCRDEMRQVEFGLKSNCNYEKLHILSKFMEIRVEDGQIQLK